MENDLLMIALIFGAIVLIPTAVVFLVLAAARARRKKKRERCRGIAEGTVVRLYRRGADSPWVIVARYTVGGADYEIRETAKLRSEAIRAGGIPVGQRKRFVLGPLQEGGRVTVRYDEQQPEVALIEGNEGTWNA